MNELKYFIQYLKTNFLFTKITNPKEITEPIVEAVNKVKSSLSKIEPTDNSHIVERLDTLISKEAPTEFTIKNKQDIKPELRAIRKAIQKEIGKIDFKPTFKPVFKPTIKPKVKNKLLLKKQNNKDILESLKKINDNISSLEMPELENYTDILLDIAGSLDNSDIVKAVKSLKTTIPKSLISRNRIKVEVDRAGGLASEYVVNTLGHRIDPATETKQDEILAKQDDIINANYPSGTGSNGSVTLTNANTAYSVPSTAPTGNYTIILYNSSDTDMYVGYEDSNSNGIELPSGGRMSFDLGS